MSKPVSRRQRGAAGEDEDDGTSEPSGHGPSAPDELDRIAPAALAAALEAIRAPAFVVRAPATVLRANARGRAMLDAERDRVLDAIRDPAPVPRGPVRFAVDAGAHFLAVFPDLVGDAAERIATVARRWALTPRQAAVLVLVAQGASNRGVAERLGCSEKTIELHVSALLSKTRCASRAQLVATFWTEQG